MRVVIAEDNTAVAEGLACYLRKAGHEVDVALDGEVALHLLEERGADLLILDYDLPRIDGAQVLKRVRSRSDHLAVMLFSAFDDAEDRLVEQGLNVDAVLAKPFGLADFEARLWQIQQRGGGIGDAPLALANDESQVLGILMQVQREAIGSASIARRLGDSGVALSPEAVERCIERLQGKLAARSMRIVQVRGLGFVLVESAASPVPSTAA